jgi:type VI protein secretion system component VasK
LELFGTTPDKVKAIKDQLAGGARCAAALQTFASDMETPDTKIHRLLQGSDLARVAVELLVKPIRTAKEAAFGGACGCLDQQWRSQVLDQYSSQLSTLYPFSKSSESDAPTPNVESFFNTFAAFVKNEIEPARALGLSVSGSFSSAAANATTIQQILARGTSKLRFSLTASTEGMAEIKIIQFHYSSDPPFDYYMGSPQTRDFKWPQAGNGDAELRVTSRQDGVYYPPLAGKGEWGIFRLIDAAEKDGNTLAWVFQTRDGRKQRVMLRIGGSDASFILAGHFTQFQCPQSVCR